MRLDDHHRAERGFYYIETLIIVGLALAWML